MKVLPFFIASIVASCTAGQQESRNNDANSSQPTVAFDDGDFVNPPSSPSHKGATTEMMAEESGSTLVHRDGTLASLSHEWGEVSTISSQTQSHSAGQTTSQPPASPPSNGSTTPSASIDGANTLLRIFSTDQFPASAVGMIENGCTGTLIGPKHVLTAAHCVYNSELGQWYSRLDFSPGRQGDDRVAGTISWSQVYAPTAYVENQERTADYALIILQQDIGETVGYLGYGWNHDEYIQSRWWQLYGYPQSDGKPAGTMWSAFCQISDTQPQNLVYPCETHRGMSGSGLYTFQEATQQRIIFAIHRARLVEEDKGIATRITPRIFARIKAWIKSHP